MDRNLRTPHEKFAIDDSKPGALNIFDVIVKLNPRLLVPNEFPNKTAINSNPRILNSQVKSKMLGPKTAGANIGIISCIICSCASHEKAPPLMIEGIAKNDQEIQFLVDSVNKGDAKAALSLAYHYLLAECNRGKAGYWFRVAAEQGGTQEKEIYRSFLEPE